jgi:hypothetical protein
VCRMRGRKVNNEQKCAGEVGTEGCTPHESLPERGGITLRSRLYGMIVGSDNSPETVQAKERRAPEIYVHFFHTTPASGGLRTSNIRV